MSALDEVGTITQGYEHVSKVVHPAPPSRPAADCSSGTTSPRATARSRARPRAGPRGPGRDRRARALAGELGFVILHRCGEGFYFLLVSTWRNENEFWETVWAKPGEDAAAFAPVAARRPGHRPTFCVWELRAVCHEQGAWSRYLRSSRDAVARREYLKDTYTGLA